MRTALTLLALAATAPAPADLLDQLQPLCGQAFAGEIRNNEPATPDDPMTGKTLIMHVRECRDGEVRIPLHVGEDRSRTWILSRTGNGLLRLKHQHLHADGAVDALSNYGGDAVDSGKPDRIDFPADAESQAMFIAEGRKAAVDNVWTLEHQAGKQFVYQLSRPGRLFRVAFDLSKPLETPPPAPWGK